MAPPVPRPRPRRRAAVVAAALALALAGCHDRAADADAAERAPLVVIAVDGLEPAIVDELLDAGRMPNLARIAERGVLGTLHTLEPTYSPVIWTTVATGQLPQAHGIVDFLTEDGLPFTSNCRKVPALWNIVSDAGRTVDVVGWWVSWPAEAVRGRVVASYAAQSQAQIVWKGNLWRDLPEQTYPPALAAEVEPFVGWIEDEQDVKRTFWEAFPRPERDPGVVPARGINDLMWTFAADRSFAAIGRHFLEHEPGDLVLVYLAIPDVAGHRFWRYWRPQDMGYADRIPPADLAEYSDFVPSAYAAADRMIGELVAAAPPDANVIVLSDHGMHADLEMWNQPDNPNSGHHQDAPPGIFAAAGPLVRQRGSLLGTPRESIGDVLGVAPLLLRMLELPVPEHWPYADRGRNPLETTLEEVWRRDHPLRIGANPDPAFREPTAARVPREGMDQQFIENLRALGYLDDGEDE